jgi:hypothetical protein
LKPTSKVGTINSLIGMFMVSPIGRSTERLVIALMCWSKYDPTHPVEVQQSSARAMHVSARQALLYRHGSTGTALQAWLYRHGSTGTALQSWLVQARPYTGTAPQARVVQARLYRHSCAGTTLQARLSTRGSQGTPLQARLYRHAFTSTPLQAYFVQARLYTALKARPYRRGSTGTAL